MTDTYSTGRARGRVLAKWVSGRSESSLVDSHNTMTYAAADAIAAAYGGETSRVPKYVGFMYGPSGKEPWPITRDMDWQYVRQMTAAINGNVQVVNFSRKPSVSSSDDGYDSNDGSRYKGNVVEFHAVTRSDVDGVYSEDTSGSSSFAGMLDNGMTMYRAVLLGDGDSCDDDDRYTVLAMVDLAKNGSYRQKPDSYELSVDWRVTFE